jgi:Cu/Ag efflux pump CusA
VLPNSVNPSANATAATGGLISWFIRNPVAANLLMVVLLVGGALSAVNLQRQVFPTISPGNVVITVPYPGATPAEVEEGITRRVEEAVLGIDGVKRVTSTASENVGRIVVETNDFADVDLVKDDIESAVDRLSQFPPENAEKPVVLAPKPTGDVVTLAVVGDVGSMALRRAAEGIERDLLSQSGVTLVSLEGDRDLEISIEVSEATLRRYRSIWRVVPLLPVRAKFCCARTRNVRAARNSRALSYGRYPTVPSLLWETLLRFATVSCASSCATSTMVVRPCS